MSKFGKIQVDIEYCVPCGYQNLAAWAVSEMFQAGGTDVALSLTPGDGGVFKIKFGDELVWDKKAMGGKSPDIAQMKEIKAKLRNKLEALKQPAGVR
jgi:selenoprotein W-related protein